MADSASPVPACRPSPHPNTRASHPRPSRGGPAGPCGIVQVYGESLLYHGRFQEAVPVFLKELVIKRLSEDDENSIASTYYQLGRASDSLGNYAESLRYYGEARQRVVRYFGTGHESVANTEARPPSGPRAAGRAGMVEPVRARERAGAAATRR